MLQQCCRALQSPTPDNERAVHIHIVGVTRGEEEEEEQHLPDKTTAGVRSLLLLNKKMKRVGDLASGGSAHRFLWIWGGFKIQTNPQLLRYKIQGKINKQINKQRYKKTRTWKERLDNTFIANSLYLSGWDMFQL